MQMVSGIVQKGAQRGKALGYPTANIPLADGSLSGIYAARVYIQDEAPYLAAVFADPKRKIAEAHLLDFSDSLYGMEIKIELHEKIRENRNFPNDDELRGAIAGDVAKVREYFTN